jgi:hypothetical protein
MKKKQDPGPTALFTTTVSVSPPMFTGTGPCGCGVIEKRGGRKEGMNEGECRYDGSWKGGASNGVGEQGRGKEKKKERNDQGRCIIAV